ncbi:MAG TPA: 4Fe-4S dicluster domain-containing protein [Candidatus Copromorpha excrementipullorum]|uniref:4Fe-4S dicluster domain-containing protein n=1 Tax=Candidatus Allocopromorpha excrementipullorum TaxID=2840743 RepID=A0A9D1SV74_9FIRM|nr:4Fe-4S dicluster domain-containing protein [Candidatus Copromorpha excrementipullorum]
MNLLDQIKDAGIIGMGGAGFPTHAKLTSEAEYILLNGAECEPLLRVDQQLMAIYPDEIIKGLVEAGRLVKAKKAIIGIKKKHGEVIELLQSRIDALGLSQQAEVKLLPDIYPAGDEQVLVYQLTGRIVPETGIPIMVGCVVINSETALNIYRASQGLPATEKYITVAGDVPNRLTVRVPVGAPVKDVLRLSGIDDFSDYAVIGGGPMMGPVLADIDGFVTKKDKGFVILKKDHFLIRKKAVTKEQARRVNRATCEQCRMCTDMCPRYLLGHNMQPHKMMRIMNYSIDDTEAMKTAQLCCQCNMCELFACPAGLHPKMANLYFKDILAEQKVKYKPEKTEFTARAVREYRLVPSKRLIARLGLRDFDLPAPMTDVKLEPDMIRVSTRQHVGAPAQPTVSAGQQVQAGQMIGTIPEGSLGACIHSSIDGMVSEVTEDYIEIRRS